MKKGITIIMNVLRTCALAAVMIGLYALSAQAESINFLFGTQGCGQVTTNSVTCDANGTIFNANAEGSLTTLRLSMDFDAVHDLGSPGLDSTTVGGGVTVNDLITITGGAAGSAGTLRADWAVEGTLAASGTGDFTLTEFDYLGAPEVVWGACGANNQYCSSNSLGGSPVSETVSISIPFVFGTPLSVQFGLRGGTSGGSLSFFNTAQLQPLVVRDSNGNQVSGATVVSDSDFRYAVADATTAVPEPASLLLFGTVVAIAGLRRRMLNRRA